MVQALSEASQSVLYSLAYRNYQQGNFANAESLFRVLTRTNVSNKNYWLGLGLSLQCHKFYQEALEAYEMAAALDAWNPHTHLQAAECLFQLNQKENGKVALDYAEKALKAKPNATLKLRLDLLREAWRNPHE